MELIKGFNKLSEDHQRNFGYTANKFMQAQGHEYKEERKIIEVKFLKKENAFKVTLANKEWQYFYLNGTWG